MTLTSGRLRRFASDHRPLVRIEVTEAKGSTPREAGAWMLVAADATFGTIGGGQLEFMAIDRARAIIGGEDAGLEMSVPLGPDIGQCCGGRVGLRFERMDEHGLGRLEDAAEARERADPHVYVFGAGHVGHALAEAFAPLPVRPVLVETRAEALADLGDETGKCLTAVPEAVVGEAPPGSAYLILTHDHSLDFLIARAALARTDAAYVGMIGSKTKRATFERWYVRDAGGDPSDFARLVSPIGGSELRDKRPAVIAALAVAEVLRAVL